MFETSTVGSNQSTRWKQDVNLGISHFAICDPPNLCPTLCWVYKGFKNYDANARLAEFFLLSEEPGDVPGQLFGMRLWQGPTGVEGGDGLCKNTRKLSWFLADFASRIA